MGKMHEDGIMGRIAENNTKKKKDKNIYLP